MHSLRHTFCTVALEDWKLPESTVCLLAGQSNPNVTRTRNVGAAEDAVQAAIHATPSRPGHAVAPEAEAPWPCDAVRFPADLPHGPCSVRPITTDLQRTRMAGLGAV